MNRLATLLAMVMLPGVLMAADIPTEVIGAENYDKETCINVNYQQCLNNICLTSEDIDCTQKCKQNAMDECEANME